MIAVIFYLGSILLANWLVVTFGIIHIGPLAFPAGAVAIGFTFSARDFVQRRFGKWMCWVWMFMAGILTYLVNPTIALASVSAFIVAETLDWLVFTYLPMDFRSRLLLSNAVGIPLDSVVFVVIAFGMNWPVVIGQSIVKFLSGTAALAFSRNRT